MERELIRRIIPSRVVAVLRAERPDRLVPAARALVESGIPTVEFTLTTPGAMKELERFCRERPEGTFVGAGTVLTPESARSAIDAGASYLVTPAVVPAVIDVGHQLKIPVIAGAFTPTEVVLANCAGATAVKVFPASLGGPRYVRLLRDPLPDIQLVPTGGIGIGDAADYLREGSIAVGLGNALLGEALTDGDVDQLRTRAETLLAAIGALPWPA